jgi:hypothetical protein
MKNFLADMQLWVLCRDTSREGVFFKAAAAAAKIPDIKSKNEKKN